MYMWLCHVVLPRDAGGMANRVDPDQTAPQEQSDLILHKCGTKNIASSNLSLLVIAMCDDTYMYEIVFHSCKTTITAPQLKSSKH